ncbi:peptide ABC transporter substrate-binding protein [Thermoflavimicrobium daqui]|uniref:Peptide ABC transporter substrate-binding protein n=1 Tax=Thermoflavimicrobium daqui TaxID=2137476 RepID=A0A364K9L5_9BACL|nr:peptide ABC transporter substrate-binding protein [Thermoflavimicrobium daqui]RAL26996.1 peptide ABC transporter substrate-binding protein [Thermoflavimicrobium daqui]
MSKWKAIILSVCLGTFLLTGCDLSSDLNLSKESEEISKDQSLELTETRMPATLDPAKFAEMNGVNVLNNIQEGLMRIGKDNRPTLGIAKSYEVSEDGKTYTFMLRSDAKWSDGRPVTANDFEYAWKRMLHPKMKAQMAYALMKVKNASKFNEGKALENQVGIHAIDNKILKIELEEADPNFLSIVAMPNFSPLRRDIVEKYKERYATNSKTMVYNGPFIMESFTPSKIILKKNPEYWDRSNVSLNQVVIHIGIDSEKEINFYQSGKLDIARLKNFTEAYRNSPDYVHSEIARVNYLLMNHTKAFFRNQNIRFALSLALNRKEIVNSLKEASTPADALVPPGITVNGQSFRDQGDKNLVSYQPQLARTYFKKGLQELKLQKIPSLVLLTPDDERKSVALEIKKQLKEILGLDVLINTPAPDARTVLKQNMKFDLLMEGWTADYNDPNSFINIWHSDSELNEGKFSSPELDRLLEATMQTNNNEIKLKNWFEAERMLVKPGELTVVIPLYFKGNAFMQKKYVKDLYRHPFGVEYSLKWAYISSHK